MSERPHKTHPLLQPKRPAPKPAPKPASVGSWIWFGVKASLWLLLLAIIGGTAAGSYYGYHVYQQYVADLPDIAPLENYAPSNLTRILAEDGTVLHEFYLEERRIVPLQQIPKHLINATLAVEDTRFYQHTGVDLYRIFGAMVKNIRSGRTVEGASTITQQLVKNVMLEDEVYQKNEEGRTVYTRSYQRKIREILLARKVEQVLGKDRILELYLNEIYYGHGAYGVQAASLEYFDKDVSELTLAESALLAALPKGPGRYSPKRSMERAEKRRNIVLNRMAAEDVGYISVEEARAAKEKPIVLGDSAKAAEEYFAPYFVEAVRLWLREQFPKRSVNEGGLTVRTGIAPAMQRAAEAAMRRGLRKVDKRIGWRGPLGLNAKREPDAKHEASYVDDTLFEGSVHVATITAIKGDDLAVELADFNLAGVVPKKGYRWAKARPGEDLVVGDRILVETDSLDIPGRESDEPPSLGEILAAADTIDLRFDMTQEPRVEGGLVALDAHTGDVRAWVGGYDFGRSKFNRVNQAKRQPGSAFKSVIFTAAMAKGLSPASVVLEAPIVVDSGASEVELVRSVERAQKAEHRKIWRPGNYGGKLHGAVTLREAFKRSYNIATIQLLREVGIGRAIAYARLLGIESNLPANLTLALGTPSVTLLEMAASYTPYPTLGKYAAPRIVHAVHDSEGVPIYDGPPQIQRVLDEETTFLMSSLMESVVQGGTGSKARRLGKSLAGKTGTTNDYKDSWFMGFSPDLVCGVYVGFDTPRNMGRMHAGSGAALPIWVDFMEQALEGTDKDFLRPENIATAVVCKSTGQLANPHCPETHREYFKTGTVPVRTCEEHSPRGAQTLMTELLSSSGTATVLSDAMDEEDESLYESD